MTVSEKPGVYTSYQVSGLVRGSNSGGAVGLAATASSGTLGQIVPVTDTTSAIAAFGSGDIVNIVSILLQNGAPIVYCTLVKEGNYESAFALLMTIPDIRYMVCDSQSASVHTKLLAAINNADEKSQYRVGVVETAQTTVQGLTSAAADLNSERMVVVSHHITGSYGYVAAALCGVMASETDPALPLNGAVLQGIGSIGANFSDADLTLLVRGGVTPLETVNGTVSVVRGISSRTTTGGAPDTTWREINTTRIIDEILPSIRDTLRANFSRVKNNAQSRDAIRTRVVIELENYVNQEIIDSYDNVTVNPDNDDPSVCNVAFDFTVAHGLNIIQLSANISI